MSRDNTNNFPGSVYRDGMLDGASSVPTVAEQKAHDRSVRRQALLDAARANPGSCGSEDCPCGECGCESCQEGLTPTRMGSGSWWAHNPKSPDGHVCGIGWLWNLIAREGLLEEG